MYIYESLLEKEEWKKIADCITGTHNQFSRDSEEIFLGRMEHKDRK